MNQKMVVKITFEEVPISTLLQNKTLGMMFYKPLIFFKKMLKH